VFDSWYGRVYDAGIQSRRLAVPGGLLLWGADLRRVYAMMADGIACEPGQVVLDAPTGGGVAFAAGTPRTRGLLLGIDLSRAMLNLAADRLPRPRRGKAGRVRLVQADATRLPLAAASVDRVLCFHSLHCLPPELHPKLLKEFRRVLKPGGSLLGTTLVADAWAPWRPSVELARLTGFFHPPDSSRLARQARRAGFRDWTPDQSGALIYFRGE
jgi:ubiquinone/menaquinone biosynthesis C-methylase UbiE